MPCLRDEFVRLLWLANFEYCADTVSAQRFLRDLDGAEVLVPKREWVEDTLPIPRLKMPLPGISNASPCCGAGSKLRGVFSGTAHMRCTACQDLWEQPAGRQPGLRLVR